MGPTIGLAAEITSESDHDQMPVWNESGEESAQSDIERMEALYTDAPSTTSQEPAPVEEPVVEAPALEDLELQEPAPMEPIEPPAAPEPVAQEPPSEEPTVEEPPAEEPAAPEPAPAEEFTPPIIFPSIAEGEIIVSASFDGFLRTEIDGALADPEMLTDAQRDSLRAWLDAHPDTFSLADVRDLKALINAGPFSTRLSQIINQQIALQPGEPKNKYLPFGENPGGVTVAQGQFAVASRGGNQPTQFMQTNQLSNCVAVVLYDPVSGVGLIAHIDARAVLTDSLQAMKEQFAALGGSFENAQRTLVTPWPDNDLAAWIHEQPDFLNTTTYSGSSVSLNLDNGELLTFFTP